MVGKTISPYRILDQIGEGRMGAVYRTSDTHPDRCVSYSKPRQLQEYFDLPQLQSSIAGDRETLWVSSQTSTTGMPGDRVGGQSQRRSRTTFYGRRRERACESD